MFVMKFTILLLTSAHYSTKGVTDSNIDSEDFVFPQVKSEYFSTCIFQNGTTGRCVNASQCPNVRDEYKSGINPKLCYFEKNDPVVCCLFTQTSTQSVSSDPVVKRRKSAASCEDIYSLPVPVPVDFTPGEFHITIVGGELTNEEEFPHMAALGWTDDDNNVNWMCGGTLISLNYILTAAHCVIGRTPPDIVRVGEKDLINVDSFTTPQDFGVEIIVTHPEYVTNQLYNDIALIKLNKNATVTTEVRPACLWQENEINFTDVIATGYGHTTFGGTSSNVLLKTDLKIVNNEECAEGYKNERSLKNGLIKSQLCAGDSTGEKDTCQGDSGGPIQISTMNEGQIVYHIVGITSFGKACATTLPGVYTRVSHYLDWIENIV